MLDIERRCNLPSAVGDSLVSMVDNKGDFCVNLAHELRAPIGSMLDMLDLLLTTCMSPKQKEYLESTYSSTQKMMRLIDEVLLFSEIEIGNMQVNLQQCHIYEILDEVLDTLAIKALKKRINIGYVIAPDIPTVVIADCSKLRCILLQLLDNAVKFTHFGEVSVYVDFLNIKQCSDGDGDPNSKKISFCIRDQGIGISSQHQQHIFEPFFQVDPSLNKLYEGTGIGLSIVKKMAELMDAQVSLQSKLALGSEFVLTLPIEQLDSQAEENESRLFENIQFLLVSRSSVIKDFVINNLEPLGATVVAVESGQEAVNQIDGNDFGVYQAILIDEDIGDMTATDFVGLVQDSLNFRDAFILVFYNPYFSSYDLDNLQIHRLSKPLKSSLFTQLIFDYFLPDQNQLKGIHRDSAEVGDDVIRVLVVEDSRIDQQVLEVMIKRLGCHCEVACNGRIGVEKVVYGRFDLVLMDCNMPILSGHAATKQIRDFEQEDAGKLPIIGMTVNSSEFEGKFCIDSGMSDLILKPLNLINMRDILTKWTAFSLAGKESDNSAELSVSEDSLSMSLTELSYDPQALNQLISVVGNSINTVIMDFFSDMETYMENLKVAVVESNASEIGYIAHTIKGAARNFGAHQLVEISSRFEETAKQGDLRDAKDYVCGLDKAISVLSTDLSSQTQTIRQLEPVVEQFESRDKVLVVDDDRTSRVILAEALRNGGCEVKEAQGGLEALDICRSCMPDLILMDAIMPGLDGFDLCQKIRKMPHGADIPILIITASESEEAVAMAFSVAATDFINKPVNISVIQKRVGHLIASSKAERYIKQLAYHDSLTGLPNRTNLMQYLELVINQSKKEKSMFAVLFLDLDHFKVVNDSMGHAVGDLLLKAVSERLSSFLRGHDFIARLGGDEFTIVLQDVKSPQIVASIAEELCQSFSQPFTFMRRKIPVTTSIGISIFPDHGNEITDLLKHADSAMFKAKTNRNRFFFYEPGMRVEVSQRIGMQRDLIKALDGDQFFLMYQPKVDFATGALIGAEALLRWQHPARGIVGPDEFIKIAEQGDIIARVNNWVLKNGINQLCDWLEAGHKLALSLNISLNGLVMEGLYSEICRMLQSHPSAKDLLELEITESALMNEPEMVGDELNKIRDLGVKIALDDFGSGHSSLNHLKKLPVDVLKIDRLFIRDIETDANDCAIVKSIICLAEALNIATVAEGVETEGQKRILKDLNCDCFQGYLVSEPIDVEKFENQFLEPLRKD